MTFVTSDWDRTRLERLTGLLVDLFPGSTIYQHVNPMHAPRDILNNRVTCVFLAAEADNTGGIELMQMLHGKKPEMPVFILSETEQLREAGLRAGAAGYLLHPIDEQQLREAVRSVCEGC